MKKFIAVLLIMTTLLSSSLVPVYAENAVESSIDHILIRKTFDDEIQKTIQSGKAKGAVATLIIEGQESLKSGYGYANEDQCIEPEPDLIGFRIGSISKTFVALAALIAAEDGKLDLNTDISKYLESDFPKLQYPVTMHHLLTHTGGFEEYLTGMAVKNVSDTEPLSITVRKYMPEQIFKPGEVASYSNYGTALAAYVIECATGIDFADYSDSRIFKPLGMNHTTFEYMQDTVCVSHAYMPDGKETLDLYMNLYPEGSAVSTAHDMGTYIKWMMSDEENLLSMESKQELLTQQFSSSDELAGIGYVWNIKTRNNHTYYDKKGQTLHFYSRVVLIPEFDAGIFLSFNTYVPDQEITEIINKVIDLLMGEKTDPISVAGANIDIEGCYVNVWSSFKTAEKLLRFFIPGKMIELTGSLSQGYQLEGEKITHLGNNAYDTPIGTVKFIERDDKTHLVTDFSQTYTRINGLENEGVTLIVTVLFLVLSLLYAVISFIYFLKKKTLSCLTGITSIIKLLSTFGLGIAIYIGILNYAILNYIFFINLASWFIVMATLTHLVYSIVDNINSELRFLKYTDILYNIVSIAFCLILLNLNLLI
ncbi:MAG: beta-lactamase family protein [Dethiosulfatibacter sp.]|nr:beta-lactamase family protein [Dethiosulfatibacter sp.]